MCQIPSWAQRENRPGSFACTVDLLAHSLHQQVHHDMPKAAHLVDILPGAQAVLLELSVPLSSFGFSSQIQTLSPMHSKVKLPSSLHCLSLHWCILGWCHSNKVLSDNIFISTSASRSPLLRQSIGQVWCRVSG